MKWGDREFKRLQAFWYQKLAESGFEDIEETKCDENRYLKKWTRTKALNSARREYHRRARGILNHYSFKTDLEREIWRMHSEGISEREISKALNCQKKSRVHVIITNIAKTIKGKEFEEEEEEQRGD